MGCIVATRKYELNKTLEVLVVIEKAKPDQNDYRCNFHISGFAQTIEDYAMGIDEVQALYLAMQKISIILYSSEEYKAKQLTWLGTFDLGLPYLENIRDLVEQHL